MVGLKAGPACLVIRSCVGCALIIRLIIQTILLDPSGAVWIDSTSDLSCLDPTEPIRPTPNIRPVIGRSRVRIPPRVPKPQFRGHLWRCRLRGGNRRSLLWVGHRAAGAPDPLRYIGVPPAFPLDCPWARVGLGVRASSIAGPLQGVASGVTRKLRPTLGGAELLVDDPQVRSIASGRRPPMPSWNGWSRNCTRSSIDAITATTVPMSNA